MRKGGKKEIEIKGERGRERERKKERERGREGERGRTERVRGIDIKKNR